ncbi:MAG: hypothetical protein R3D88_03360 [Alphaproteobacteria bacterium]|nr:hypothetical protein [Alphaproteobacteria bacterium]
MFGGFSKRGSSLEGSGTKEIKRAEVIDTKAAPTTGYKRVLVREKSVSGQMAAIDIPVKEAGKIEKKKTYNFAVEEKDENRYGASSRSKKCGFKTYICEDAPEIYDRKSDTGHRDFNGGNGSKTVGRTKFY